MSDNTEQKSTIIPNIGRWTLSLSTTAQPSCPACGAPLQNDVTAIKYDIAWCHSCRHHGSLPGDQSCSIMDDPTLSNYWQVRCGLKFYVLPCRANVSIYDLDRLTHEQPKAWPWWNPQQHRQMHEPRPRFADPRRKHNRPARDR